MSNAYQDALDQIESSNVVQIESAREPKQQPNNPETLDLLKHLPPNSWVKSYIECVAKSAHMPVNTTFLTMIGVISGVASRTQSVVYQDETPLPLGEYIACSQPPATGKSRVLRAFQNVINRTNAKAIAAQKEREIEFQQNDDDAEWKERPIQRIFLTDATPEAIDKNLSNTSGFFSLASAEQGLINTIMGASYQKGKANNDLALKGFNGEYHASARANRDGFVGDVVGSITCFAQRGGIETILNTSEGVGFAERFLMLNEPDQLGKRDHTQYHGVPRDLQQRYDDIAESLTHKACAIQYMDMPPRTLSTLMHWNLSPDSWDKIATFRNEIEPHLAEGEKYGTAIMQGISGKVDIHIMKLATLLHIMHTDKTFGTVSYAFVEAAINIMRDMMEYTLHLMGSFELTGRNAYEASIIEYIGKTRNVTRTMVTQNKRRSKPWSQINDSKLRTDKFHSTIDSLIRRGYVVESETFDATGKSNGKHLRVIA